MSTYIPTMPLSHQKPTCFWWSNPYVSWWSHHMPTKRSKNGAFRLYSWKNMEISGFSDGFSCCCPSRHDQQNAVPLATLIKTTSWGSDGPLARRTGPHPAQRRSWLLRNLAAPKGRLKPYKEWDKQDGAPKLCLLVYKAHEHPLISCYIWLVVEPSLWRRMTMLSIWTNRKCSKPPTSRRGYTSNQLVQDFFHPQYHGGLNGFVHSW